MYRTKKAHPALKHGGYAASRLLPGEDLEEFNKLHERVVEYLSPNGPLEEDLAYEVARLLWRKQHLGTFQLARDAKSRRDAIEVELGLKEGIQKPMEVLNLGSFGHACKQLMRELDVEARINSDIKKCLKMFYFLKGMKSITQSPELAPKTQPARLVRGCSRSDNPSMSKCAFDAAGRRSLWSLICHIPGHLSPC
jgi:hypothetical protein